MRSTCSLFASVRHKELQRSFRLCRARPDTQGLTHKGLTHRASHTQGLTRRASHTQGFHTGPHTKGSAKGFPSLLQRPYKPSRLPNAAKSLSKFAAKALQAQWLSQCSKEFVEVCKTGLTSLVALPAEQRVCRSLQRWPHKPCGFAKALPAE